uniref:Co-chaperonin GroES n=1 Tax=uncultured virus TaxID=340016 RepID=A0A221S3K5_9VIRU|nr:co-chaperonin GroES [uncultured virus]
MDRNVTKVLGARILIKKKGFQQKVGDLVIEDDGQSLPVAEVILVAEQVKDVAVGDLIHYTESRETGKCSHNGEEHFVIPVSNAVAIL